MQPAQDAVLKRYMNGYLNIAYYSQFTHCYFTPLLQKGEGVGERDTSFIVTNQREETITYHFIHMLWIFFRQNDLICSVMSAIALVYIMSLPQLLCPFWQSLPCLPSGLQFCLSKWLLGWWWEGEDNADCKIQGCTEVSFKVQFISGEGK